MTLARIQQKVCTLSAAVEYKRFSPAFLFTHGIRSEHGYVVIQRDGVVYVRSDREAFDSPYGWLPLSAYADVDGLAYKNNPAAAEFLTAQTFTWEFA